MARPTQAEKRLRRFSRIACMVCSFLCISIIATIVVVEVLYGTHVPGYVIHQPLLPGDNVRIEYKNEAGYTGGSMTSRTILISAMDYETLPMDFEVYQDECDTLNDHTVTTTVTTNVMQWTCVERCRLDEYVYLVNMKGSWITYNVTSFHITDSAAANNLVLRFVLFDNYFNFHSFIMGNNVITPLQEVYVSKSKEEVTFDVSGIRNKAASYYFIGIEILGTNETVTMDIQTIVNKVTYYISYLVKGCFACVADITNEDDITRKQCFIVRAVPRGDEYTTTVINVTAQVSAVDKTSVHGVTLSLTLSFLFSLILPCITLFVIGFTKIKLHRQLHKPTQTAASHCTANHRQLRRSGSRNSTRTEATKLIELHDPNQPLIQEETQSCSSSLMALEDCSSGGNVGRTDPLFYVIKFLKSKSVIDCFTFSRHLGISLEKLTEIEKAFRHDKSVYISRILSYWQSTRPVSTKQQESVLAIAKALKASGYHILSAIIVNEFSSGDMTSAASGVNDDVILDHLFSQNPHAFNQEPSMDDLCTLMMTDEILAKWELLGTLLGLPKHAIDIIKMENYGVCRNCLLQLFDEWRLTQSKPYTWSTVIKVLHSSSFSEYLLDEKVYEFCLKPK